MSTGFTPFLLQLRSRQDLAENPYLLYYAEARLAVHWTSSPIQLDLLQESSDDRIQQRENAVIAVGVGW
jgi:hypothetical protein